MNATNADLGIGQAKVLDITSVPPTASKLAHELQEIRCLQPLFRVVSLMEQTKTTHLQVNNGLTEAQRQR